MDRALTLDAGALIALDRGSREAALLIMRALETGATISVPAGALAQAWRDGRLQARLARLLAEKAVEVVPLDGRVVRAVGVLCGATGTSDVVDASVVLCARARGAPIATSDPQDLRRLDPGATLYDL